MFFILIWTIWKERNCIIFNNCSRSVAETLEMALLQLRWWISGWKEPFPYSFDEILKNQSCLIWNESTGAINFINPQVCMQHWEPPPINHLKWIIDASVMASQSGSTIGGILRNNEGKFKCMFSSPIPPIEINCAEILAIYRAIQISLKIENIKNHPILIESNSHNAVRCCNEDWGGPWNMNFQLNFIRSARKIGYNFISSTSEEAPMPWQTRWQSKGLGGKMNS